MARTIYVSKNRFVRRSKMSESQFVTLLFLFLEGLSAKDARHRFSSYLKSHDALVPSVKTIARLFTRVGRYTFHKVVEPQLWMTDAAICQSHLDDGQDAYQKFLDQTAQNLILNAREQMSLEMFHTLADSKHVGSPSDMLNMEIRALLVARKGVTDIRADVGLACYRAEAPGGLPRRRVDKEHIDKMATGLLQDMITDPLDNDGNVHSYIRTEPYRFPYANFGYPDWDQMHKKGFSIKAWNKRHAQKAPMKQKKPGK
ncbi:hypothetical protein [Roseobacter sp. MH60115]|uniref:hypothetical protein n=1 Tax=Roseobacter sp. MH60115 TaxID=2785324 RepID=UPI0018A28D00|nr:hypothetical protein [Roseobacter sp. MH60115]